MKQYNRVYASINLDAIAYNMEQMEKRIGGKTQIMVVIKSDGYGHGAVPIAELSEEVDYVWGYATASLDEAKVLREAGIKKPILVLGCVFPDQYEDMINFDIRGAVYTWEMAQGMADAAKNLGKTAVVHIKIDTGMGRIGFKVDEESADIIRDIWQMNHISVEGLFTHFSKADETDKSYTKMQHDKFVWMKQALQERRVEIPYLNCDNSAGIIDFPDLKHDLVRAGISLYGMYPSDEVEQEVIDLHPALELISHVTFVKDIEAGTAISYGGTFVSEKPMRVATIPVGYGDGYPRSLSNKGEVLIRGRRARILGRVCMDQFIVDVTDIPGVQFMDRVTLVGRDGEEHICVEELSGLSGRFNYEFVCCLSKRIPRVYTKGGNVVIQKDCF